MDPTYLREQAQRCRRLADAISDEKAKLALVELTVEYEERAKAEESEGVVNEG